MHALTDLPDDVLVEIVVRLPAHSIARCRAVCRAWRSAISHASFDIALAGRPATVATVTANRMGFEFRTDYAYASEDTTPTLVSGTCVVFDFYLRWRRRPPCPLAVELISDSLSSIVTTVRGSWDSVLCIERGVWKSRPLRYHVEEYVLWNPVTKAYAAVSPPADRGKVIGAYAHPTTRAFHLVHGSGEIVNDHLMGPTTFWIRRVGDDMAWREIPLEEESSTNGAQPSQMFISSSSCNARCVGSRGNLHWLALSGSGALRVLALDTSSQDRLRQIEAPELGRGPADLAKVRLGTLSGGKLCIFSVEPSMSSMDVWVLDGYRAAVRRSSWRLKERISLVELPWTFNAATEVEVEVVEGVGEGEEIFLHRWGWIDVYNIRCKTWRGAMEVPGLITLGSHVSLVMHRKSAVQHEVSFGQASRAVSWRIDSDGTHLYNLA